MIGFVPVGAFDIVIFGATGDLSTRKLLPALYHRWLDGQFPLETRIIGSARSELDRDAFVALTKDACARKQEDGLDEDKWAGFASCLDYIAMDATAKDASWGGLKNALSGVEGRPCVFYLATPPSLYVPICEGLGAAGLNGPEARIVLEKPIGRDLASAIAINDGVGAVFPESNIYRIDHYLGKETVQNLMVLRFANTLFEPVWKRADIDHVQITVAETLGAGDRATYYDRSGALRDMVQNHLLQLLCLTAMEVPGSIDEDDVRTEKIKVLRALRTITPGTVSDVTVRAQYVSGVADGAAVPGYLEELNSDDISKTETFVAIKAEIDNWRWSGVPFYLRTGKRMAERHSEIIVQFKPTPHSVFGGDVQSANRLVIRLQPDEGVRMYIQIKEPGPGGLRIKSLPLDLSYAETFTVRYPDAYERLLMDIVRGNLSLFMRRDEVEAAWAWVDGVIEAWEISEQVMDTYSAGSNGPSSADFLLRQDARAWWD